MIFFGVSIGNKLKYLVKNKMRIKKRFLTIVVVFIMFFFAVGLFDTERSSVIVTGQKANTQASVAPQTVLKKYYVKGAKYNSPCLYRDGKIVSSSVQILANGSSLPIQDETFTVPDCENLSFTFKTAEGNVVENRPIVDVGFGGELAINKYFTTTGGKITAEDKYLRLTNTIASTSYDFIREIDVKNFNIQFKINEENDTFENVAFKFTNYLDDTNSIVITIFNRDELAFLSINGGEEISLDRSFTDSSKNYSLSLSSGKVTIDDVSVTLEDNIGLFAYFGIAVTGLDENVSMEISLLNSQPLNNYKSDIWTPNVFFTSSYGGEIGKNDTYKITPVYAIDVLDPYTEINFSVRTPSGEYVTSVDGVELKNVSASKTYEFVASEYGKYSCSYSYQDSFENRDRFAYVISVLDTVKPVVTPKKTVIRGTVGEALNVPEYKIGDNHTPVSEITVSIQVIDCNNKISTVKKGQVYIPESVGVYTIRYMAIDNDNNLGFAEVICVVSEGANA